MSGRFSLTGGVGGAQWHHALWGALAVMTLLRFITASVVPLADDEAYYRLWSLSPAWSYLDHPPMVAWLIAAGRVLAGDSELGIRLAGPLLSLVAALALWRTASLLFGANVAALAVAFALSMPLLNAGAIVITPDLPSVLFFTLGVWALAELRDSDNANWWLAVGMFAGLGLLSKYTNLFLGASILLWLVLIRANWRWFGSWQLWAGGLLAGLLALPVIMWNIEYDGASFAKQLGRAIDQRSPGPFTVFEFAGGLLMLMGPVVAVLAFIGVWQGLRASVRRADVPEAVLAAAILPLLSYFAIHAISDRVQANWPAPIYPLLAIAAAQACITAIGQARQRNVALLGIAVGLTMSLAIYLHAAAPLVLRADFKEPTHQLRGWPELAANVEDLARREGAAWIATTSYATTAKLAYHLGDRIPVVQLDERLRYVHLPQPSRALLSQPALYLELERRARPDILASRFRTVGATVRLIRGERSVEIAPYLAVPVAEAIEVVLGPQGKAARGGVR